MNDLSVSIFEWPISAFSLDSKMSYFSYYFLIKSKYLAFMEPDRMQKRYRNRRSSSSTLHRSHRKRSKRAIPHIIYPEILVIVDYDGYRLHGGDNTQVCWLEYGFDNKISWTSLIQLFSRLKDILYLFGMELICDTACSRDLEFVSVLPVSLYRE